MCRCRNIFSIQQCLTNITSNRESDLDHARQYYELLYQPPDVSLPLILLLCCFLLLLRSQFHIVNVYLHRMCKYLRHPFYAYFFCLFV